MADRLSKPQRAVLAALDKLGFYGYSARYANPRTLAVLVRRDLIVDRAGLHEITQAGRDALKESGPK